MSEFEFDPDTFMKSPPDDDQPPEPATLDDVVKALREVRAEVRSGGIELLFPVWLLVVLVAILFFQFANIGEYWFFVALLGTAGLYGFLRSRGPR